MDLVYLCILIENNWIIVGGSSLELTADLPQTINNNKIRNNDGYHYNCQLINK